MEPSAYKSWTLMGVQLPPQAPVNEEPMKEQEESMEERVVPNPQSAELADTEWTPIPSMLQPCVPSECSTILSHSPANPFSNLTAATRKPADTNWKVYSMSIARGNLDKGADPNDPREHVGWNSAIEKGKDMPWHFRGTFTEQQPFMSWSALEEREEDVRTPRPTDYTAAKNAYPHPTLSIPQPNLSMDFRMSITLNPQISIGTTSSGYRGWVSFSGGTWFGPWGKGVVLPGGQDSQTVTPDGAARMDSTYLLETHDNPPAHIVMKTHGWRTETPQTQGLDLSDARNYSFRLFVEMETGDQRYMDKVNCGMWVGSGIRKGAEVVYDAYRVS